MGGFGWELIVKVREKGDLDEGELWWLGKGLLEWGIVW